MFNLINRYCLRLRLRYHLLNQNAKDIIKLLFFAAFFLFLIVLGTSRLRYDWQWYRIPKYIFKIDETGFHAGPLLKGVAVTIEISAVSLFFTFFTGLLTALLRLSDSIMAKAVSRVYLEIVRNTPLLIQLFFIYFVISPIFDISAFTAAVIALSLFEGAYTSEIIRAGIMSVPKAQTEAALALGMRKSSIYLKIIFPQAAYRMMPILASQAISLVKDSSLVSAVAIYDLTMRGQEIVADTFLSFEIWFTVAIIYLMITGLLSFAISRIEKEQIRRGHNR